MFDIKIVDLKDKPNRIIGDENDTYGNLRNIDTIIEDLQEYYDSYPTHAMSDYALSKKAAKDTLGEVLDYLKRIAE
jgi:hypothetical protein